MKKLLLATVISSVSTIALAGDHIGHKIPTFAELDQDANGSISQQELSQTKMADKFAKLDTNSDSMISKDEFKTFLSTRMTASTDDMSSDVEADPVATTLDGAPEAGAYAQTNARDAYSTPTTDADSVDMKVDKQAVAETEFKMLDANQDGMLTKAEAMESQTDMNFDDIDTDDNEKISVMEYSNYIQEMSEE